MHTSQDTVALGSSGPVQDGRVDVTCMWRGNAGLRCLGACVWVLTLCLQRAHVRPTENT